MIVYLLLVCAILISLHLLIRYRRFGRLIHEIPGPKSYPIFGNVLSFNLPSEQLWMKAREMQKEYPIFKLWFGFVAMAATRDPDDVKILLSCKKNINKELRTYRNIQCCSAGGLVVLNGKCWELRRKIMNQAFTPNVLELYLTRLDKRVKKFTGELLSNEKVAIHDVSHMFMKFAFDLTCEATMDFDLDTVMEQKGDDFRNAFIEVGEICYYRLVRPYVQDWMMKFLPTGRRQAKLWKILREFAGKVIEERRKYHESMGYNVFKDYLDKIENGIQVNKKVPRKHLSVLDVLLLSEQQGLMDSEGVLSETILMIAAGFETTGVAIMFLVILLAENQKAQDFARKELLDVVGGYGNEITMDHINKLDYLERCAKESMRIFTVTPYIGRSLDEDVKLSKYTIPAGTEMYICIFDLHRDPDLWPDPLKFDPDRFLPENLKNQHPFAYVPFSKGLRSCIGRKLAMREIKTLVANILYNFHLEAIDRSADFEFNLGVTLQLKSARVKFTRLDKT